MKRFIQGIFEVEGKVLNELGIIFCDDIFLHGLNKGFLKHDTYTDILTFEFSENDEPVNGEIYISIERVKENAVTYESSFQQELHRVIFHGILHLCKYNDKSSFQKSIIREKENFYLREYFCK